MNKAIDVVENHSSMFSDLDAEMEIVKHGIVLIPNNDPHHVREKLLTVFDLSFSREMNGSGTSYSWVSLLDDVPLYILANECLDHTGTIVTH